MAASIHPSYFVVFSAALFVIGIYGALVKKNVIAVLMSTELMLAAANINFVAFNKYIAPDGYMGQVFVIFVITVAAVEIGLGLALIIAITRKRTTSELDKLDWLKW